MNEGQDNEFGGSVGGSRNSGDQIPQGGVSDDSQVNHQGFLPLDSASGDIVLNEGGRRKKKGWIIGVVVFVVFILGVSAFFVVSKSNKSRDTNYSDQEVHNLLRSFYNNHYKTLVEQYDFVIGLDFASRDEKSDMLFPIYGMWIERFSDNLDNARVAFNEMPTEGSDNYKSIRNGINEALSAFERDIELLDRYYDAFIAPFGLADRPENCDQNEDMKFLLSGDSRATAEKYYNIYCGLVKFLRESEDVEAFETEHRNEIIEARKELDGLLTDIYPFSQEIENLLMEMSYEVD